MKPIANGVDLASPCSSCVTSDWFCIFPGPLPSTPLAGAPHAKKFPSNEVLSRYRHTSSSTMLQISDQICHGATLVPKVLSMLSLYSTYWHLRFYVGRTHIALAHFVTATVYGALNKAYGASPNGKCGRVLTHAMQHALSRQTCTRCRCARLLHSAAHRVQPQLHATHGHA